MVRHDPGSTAALPDRVFSPTRRLYPRRSARKRHGWVNVLHHREIGQDQDAFYGLSGNRELSVRIAGSGGGRRPWSGRSAGPEVRPGARRSPRSRPGQPSGGSAQAEEGPRASGPQRASLVRVRVADPGPDTERFEFLIGRRRGFRRRRHRQCSRPARRRAGEGSWRSALSGAGVSTGGRKRRRSFRPLRGEGAPRPVTGGSAAGAGVERLGPVGGRGGPAPPRTAAARRGPGRPGAGRPARSGGQTLKRNSTTSPSAIT